MALSDSHPCEYFNLQDEAVAFLKSQLNAMWGRGREGPRDIPRLPLLPIICPPRDRAGRSPYDFQYQPLPTLTTIRLLKVHPVNIESEDISFDLFRPPIQCSMVLQDLQECPTYDALSYTWGDPCTLYRSAAEVFPSTDWAARAFDIVIDGQPVSISTNLYTALLSLRFFASQPSPKTISGCKYSNLLWVDAVCINQADCEERNNQVKMMSRIYKQSTTVFVWLGGGDRFSYLAVESLSKLMKFDPSGTHEERMKSLSFYLQDTYEELGLDLIGMDSWIGVYMLLSRAWFYRVWTVQEAAFAKNPVAICGMIQFRLSTIWESWNRLDRVGWFTQLISRMEPLVNDQPDPALRSAAAQVDTSCRFYRPYKTSFPRPKFARNMIRLQSSLGTWKTKPPSFIPRWPFVKLLMAHRLLEATDPRDKVYAVWAMSKEAQGREDGASNDAQTLSVAYNLSVREVYTKAARFIINATKDLSILTAKEPYTRIPDLPSWVPDLSVGTTAGMINEAGYWMASLAAGGEGSFNLEADKLRLSGVKVARIRDRSCFHVSNIKGIPRFLRGLPEFSMVPCPRHLGPGDLETAPRTANESKMPEAQIVRQSRFEVFCRTLINDHFEGEHPALIDCCGAILDIFQHELRSREATAIFAQLCGSNMLRGTVNDQAHAKPVLNYNQARDDVWRYYDDLQQLLGNQGSCGNDTIDFPSEFEIFEADLAKSEKGCCKTKTTLKFCDKLQARGLSSRGKKMKTELGRALGDRALFTTDQGHLGIGIKSLAIDDEIWIIPGVNVPLILRRLALEGQYCLVGEAYVHGIMHGEAINDWASENVENITLG